MKNYALLARQIIVRDEDRVLRRVAPQTGRQSGVCTAEACAKSHDQLDD
jgi:hypothetical protein